MKIIVAASLLVVLAAGPALAQGRTNPATPAEAPSMASSATTLAPVAPGSTTMHEVPTPSVDKRSTTIGTEDKLTGKGGN